jgi:hypothetical protein
MFVWILYVDSISCFNDGLNSYHPGSQFCAKNGGRLVPESHLCGAGNIELFFGVYFSQSAFSTTMAAGLKEHSILHILMYNITQNVVK